VEASWRDAALGAKWDKVREVRRVVTGALEIERQVKKTIGASLEAAPVVYVSDPDLLAALDGVDLAEISITSDARLVAGEGPADAFRLDEVAGVAVVPEHARGRKCARSWKISEDVGADPEFPDITPRDAEAVREWQEAQGRVADGAGPTPTPVPARDGKAQPCSPPEGEGSTPGGGGLPPSLSGGSGFMAVSPSLGLAIAVVVFAIDQLHKWWMLGPFDIAARQPVTVAPFLDLVLAWNHGISYGWFAQESEAGRWALIGLSLVVTLGLWLWLAQARRADCRGGPGAGDRRGARQHDGPRRPWRGRRLLPVPRLRLQLVCFQHRRFGHRCRGDPVAVRVAERGQARLMPWKTRFCPKNLPFRRGRNRGVPPFLVA
jgi:hypothetical protein